MICLSYVSHCVSLLKEAEIHAEQREFEMNRRRQMGLSTSHHSLDNLEFDNKEDDQHDQRLLSQFGIWLLVRSIFMLIGVSVCEYAGACFFNIFLNYVLD